MAYRYRMEIVLNPDVPYAELPNAGDETLDWNLRSQLALDPDTTRYRLVELPLSVFVGSFSDAEAYLLDGGGVDYTTTLELADILEAGGELDPVVVCDQDAFYRTLNYPGGIRNQRRLVVFDGCHRLYAHALAGRERVRSYELILSIPACPGPDCPECAGEACRLCGAGLWRWPLLQGEPACEHDSAERHTSPDDNAAA
jgi:uncharacterized ParB-like nuclease family protein